LADFLSYLQILFCSGGFAPKQITNGINHRVETNHAKKGNKRSIYKEKGDKGDEIRCNGKRKRGRNEENPERWVDRLDFENEGSRLRELYRVLTPPPFI
jgi:hypothetical protein